MLLRHGKNNLRFKYRGMKTQVLLPGDEYRKYQQRRHTGLDVFFVQERRDKARHIIYCWWCNKDQ